MILQAPPYPGPRMANGTRIENLCTGVDVISSSCASAPLPGKFLMPSSVRQGQTEVGVSLFRKSA